MDKYQQFLTFVSMSAEAIRRCMDYADREAFSDGERYPLDQMRKAAECLDGAMAIYQDQVRFEDGRLDSGNDAGQAGLTHDG